jgi:effector-binding domain-containing protein
MIGEPKIDQRPEIMYMGIRVQTPMKGMCVVADKLFKELNRWAMAHGVEPTGLPFLRLHVIDMAGEMDIEVCLPVAAGVAGDARVTPSVLPAGRYASVNFIGNTYSGSKALLEWARDHGLQWDRWDDERGDAFRARIERALTDPKVEPRKTRRETEVAIKLAEDQRAVR